MLSLWNDLFTTNEPAPDYVTDVPGKPRPSNSDGDELVIGSVTTTMLRNDRLFISKRIHVQNDNDFYLPRAKNDGGRANETFPG